MRVPLFDSHAHLDDPQLLAQADEVVERATAAGVEGIVAVGTTATSSHQCVLLAERFDIVYAAVGLQPNEVARADAGDWEAIERLATSGHPRIVALGETGLDRYWDDTPWQQQQDYFDRHLRLSQQTGLPFIVHMRDCMDDVLQMLREARSRAPLVGVMHSYTGTKEQAEEALQLGLHVSFAGMVTFKKSAPLREVARQIPADRLLIETDSPYLSPDPLRGKRPNEPARIVHTATCLADVRGVSLGELAEQTTANARRLFLSGE